VFKRLKDDKDETLTAIEQKVLAIGEAIGVALSLNEQVDLVSLAGELHDVYTMIGEIKDSNCEC